MTSKIWIFGSLIFPAFLGTNSSALEALKPNQQITINSDGIAQIQNSPGCPANSNWIQSTELSAKTAACSKAGANLQILATQAPSGGTWMCVQCQCNPPIGQGANVTTVCLAMGESAETNNCTSSLGDLKNGATNGACNFANGPKTDTKVPTTPALPKQGPVPATKPASDSSPAATTGNETADQQTCQQKATDASQCCQNPMSCLNTAIQLGYVNASDAALAQAYSSGALTTNQATIQQSCTQLQQASLAMQNVNAGLSSMCYGKKSECVSSCLGFKQNYNTTTFDGAISSCQGLSQNVAALGQSANQNVQNAMVAQQCQQMTAASAQATNPMSTSPATTPGTQPTGDSAGGSSGLDGAAVGRSDPGLFTQQPITGSYSGTDPSNFDVGTTGASADGTQQQASIPISEAQPSSAAVVPNNTGGALPGSGDSGANGSSASPSGSSGSQASSSKAGTDVLHGNRSGGGFVSGGASSSGGFGTDSGDSSGFNFGKFAGKFGKKAAGQDLSKYQGLDLKQYLPGGARDPHRGLASVGRGQIRPSGDDLFIAITSRIKLMCKLGNLLDCR